MGCREGLFKAAGALDEDRLIRIGPAASGAGTVDDEVGRGDFIAKAFDVGFRGKVAGERAISTRFCQSGDMEISGRLAGDFRAEKSGAGDEEISHLGKSSSWRARLQRHGHIRDIPSDDFCHR